MILHAEFRSNMLHLNFELKQVIESSMSRTVYPFVMSVNKYVECWIRRRYKIDEPLS
jgi:hypothetical protein